jgi:hypothetical protein
MTGKSKGTVSGGEVGDLGDDDDGGDGDPAEGEDGHGDTPGRCCNRVDPPHARGRRNNNNNNTETKTKWIQCEECWSWFHGLCLKLIVENYRQVEWLCAACTTARPGLVLSSGGEGSETEEEIAGQTTRSRTRKLRKRKNTARMTAADSFRKDLTNSSPSPPPGQGQSPLPPPHTSPLSHPGTPGTPSPTSSTPPPPGISPLSSPLTAAPARVPADHDLLCTRHSIIVLNCLIQYASFHGKDNATLLSDSIHGKIF